MSESGEIPSKLDDSATTDWEPMVMDPYDSDTDDDSYDPDQEASDSDDDTTSYGAVVVEESFESDIDEGADAEEDVEEAPDKVPPNTEMLNGFHDYCSTNDYNFVQLSKEEITSIKLLDILKRKKAPLNAFEEVLEWHLKAINHLREGETLKDTIRHFRRETVMKRLVKRYNVEPMMPKLKKIRLPHSKAVVTIPYRDAADCIVSLLTDPRV